MLVTCVIQGRYDCTSTANNKFSLWTGEIVTVNYSDIHQVEDIEAKYPPAPWERRYAAYAPPGRTWTPSWHKKRCLIQQRPRDGLHAIK